MRSRISEAVRVDPNDASSYASRAIAYGKKNELDAALASFASALTLQPETAWIYFERGTFFEQQGKFLQAMKRIIVRPSGWIQNPPLTSDRPSASDRFDAQARRRMEDRLALYRRGVPYHTSSKAEAEMNRSLPLESAGSRLKQSREPAPSTVPARSLVSGTYEISSRAHDKMPLYIVGHKMRETQKFATVLQLEPLHTCNLTCTGCGRIREYSTNLKDLLPLEDCLSAAEECNAPMVSICGGEPLIYPQIEALVGGLLEQNRIVYICTNAMFMRKKMREWLAARVSEASHLVEEKITALMSAGLITEKDANAIQQGPERSGQAGPSGRADGCIGTFTSMASSGRTI